MTTNIILITSIINPPQIPLSYSPIRSIYTPDERFNQTKLTISSIYEKIPNPIIFILECSQLTTEQSQYLTQHSHYFINIFDNNHNNTYNTDIINNIYSISKSLAESTITSYGITYIKQHILPQITNTSINFFKISGRYCLNENFNYNLFKEKHIAVFKKIEGNDGNILTALYKLPITYIDNLHSFLTNTHNINLMNNCIGYEVLFSSFLKSLPNMEITYLDTIGLSGNVTIDGSLYYG